jgi:16S rRNA (cytosine967-C5)-methyltransferase
MVNAVLRRAAPELERLLAEGTLAERWSHPEWLVERWLEHHGPEATRAVLEADQQPADLWVWLRVPETDATSEVASLRLEQHPWCPGAYRSERPARELIERVSDGRAYAQDPSSQLVARVAMAAAPEATTIADLCAAPGGKAAMIAWHRPGLRLVAIDRHLGRCRLVAGLLPGAVVAGDATEAPLAPQSVDLVLLDAPCSGSGTLRRHPELRWRLSPAGIAEMAAVQTRLLGAARELVRPGGVLVYATCSIEPEENERLLDPIPPGFEPVDLRPLLPPGCPADSTAAGGARILPRPEADGFTIHALRRVE